MPHIKHRLGRVLWGIIGLSIFLHAFFLILGLVVFKDWRLAHEPAHAALEAAGAVIALVVALWLSSLDTQGRGTSYNGWIAGALVAMGLLDGFHAVSHAGNTFVWLHSTAMFVGGIMFSLVWLPGSLHHRLPVSWPLLVGAVVMVFGLWSLYAPEHTPVMVEADEFTREAKALNLIGGLLMLLACVRFLITWRRTKNVDDLLFFLHCLLFGSAAIMFEQSQLWDLPWWGWHVLRFLAYGVAFWFVFRSQEQLMEELRLTHLQLEAANTDLEKRVRRRTAELQQAVKELESFAYVASHDLQEPVRTIIGFSKLLSERLQGKLDAESERYLNFIHRSADRSEKLIIDILQYSRLGREKEKKTQVDLDAIFKEVLEDLTVSVNESQARIDVNGEWPTVSGRSTELRLLLTNLLSNAIKFRKPDHAPSIAITVENVGDVWQFQVADDGIGFDQQGAKKVFVLFRRLRKRTEYPGTGIGLAHCKKIVEHHGGEIWVTSAPGKGSTFHFTLPK